MKTLSIQLKDKQYELLTRIAKEETRRLSDFLYVLVGNGLSLHFCEHGIVIRKTDSELTEEEKKTIANNEVLAQTEGWYSLSMEEREAKGWKHVDTTLSNYSCHSRKDDFIEMLSDSILALALTDNPTEEYP